MKNKKIECDYGFIAFLLYIYSVAVAGSVFAFAIVERYDYMFIGIVFTLLVYGCAMLVRRLGGIESMTLRVWKKSIGGVVGE